MLTRITAVLCGLVLLTGVATVAFEYGASQAAAGVGAGGGSAGELDFLEEIIDTLDEDAVRAPDDEELVTGATQGLLEALDDPYARYYDASAFDDLNTMLDGGFSGIGVVIEETPRGL